MSHTPTPWTVEPRQWDHGASLAIVAPNSGYIIAVIPFDEDIQEVDEPDGDTVIRHPDEEPNAAHIVRCVNNHEALVKALKSLVKEIDLSKLNVRKDFSLLNAHAFATKTLHQAEEA